MIVPARLPEILAWLCDDSGVTSLSMSKPVVVYDGAVSRADLDVWNSELEGLFSRMRPLFYRTESRKHAEQYVRGLLAPLERKNGWTIAEYVGEPEPTALQRFLNLSPWDVDALLALNREYAMGHLASPRAILVADPTGFAKKGTYSVGVQRQYSGTLGRIDNCQIATFLAYVTPDRDRVLLDRRLYLPKESWVADPARCAAAGVPLEVVFKTRPQQVREMIEAALAAGVPFAWFTADEEFGSTAMDVDQWRVVWAGGRWGGAHGRDLGSTAPTHTEPGAARARDNLTEPVAEPARDSGSGSRIVAGGLGWW